VLGKRDRGAGERTCVLATRRASPAAAPTPALQERAQGGGPGAARAVARLRRLQQRQRQRLLLRRCPAVPPAAHRRPLRPRAPAGCLHGRAWRPPQRFLRLPVRCLRLAPRSCCASRCCRQGATPSASGAAPPRSARARQQRRAWREGERTPPAGALPTQRPRHLAPATLPPDRPYRLCLDTEAGFARGRRLAQQSGAAGARSTRRRA
jgi:hypothetical protein